MGLPMHFEPSAPESASKSTEKSAAVPRSSIRRSRSVRGPTARLTHSERRRRILGMVESSLPPGILGEVERPRPAYIRPGSDDSTPDTGNRRQQSTSRSRPTTSQLLSLRDNWSFERLQPHPEADVDGPLMPAVPESRDYSDSADRQRAVQRLYRVRADLRRIARRRPAPTPPYTETDLDFISRMSAADSPRVSSTTPNVNPRNIDDSDDSTPTDSIANYSVEEHRAAAAAHRQALTERVAELNRINNRHVQNSQQLARQARRLDGLGERLNGLDSRLNGLGDRDRSLSPEGSGAWDTLLTGITPDPQPPSVGSSFASSSAAAATLPSDTQPNSANTSMTSLIGPDGPAIPECDLYTDSDSTDFNDDELNQPIEFSSRRRLWRSYADVVTAREHRGDRATGENEPSGGDMDRIILRLAARDEIPAEWWAHTAGEPAPHHAVARRIENERAA